MKHIWNKVAYVLLASSIALTACDKDDQGELSGPMPVASFTTSAPRVVGLTTEVTFTSTSTDAFLYQWDFGDGTIGSGQTVTHVYKTGGTIKTQLTVAGKGGTNISEQKDVVLPPIIDAVKQLLTGGSSKTWKLDRAAQATIVVGTEGNPSQYYAGADPNTLPLCQADDEFTFSNANVYTYDAKAETFVAAAAATATTPAIPAACSAPRSGTSDFTFGPATGNGYAMIEFKKAGTFIGVTDAPDLTYRIIDITENSMVIRAGRPSGTVFQMKLVTK